MTGSLESEGLETRPEIAEREGGERGRERRRERGRGRERQRERERKREREREIVRGCTHVSEGVRSVLVKVAH